MWTKILGTDRIVLVLPLSVKFKIRRFAHSLSRENHFFQITTEVLELQTDLADWSIFWIYITNEFNYFSGGQTIGVLSERGQLKRIIYSSSIRRKAVIVQVKIQTQLSHSQAINWKRTQSMTSS